MNTPSASRAERILVWDAPVRVFHWLLAVSFLGAYITAESERWRLVHVTLGYTVAGLVVFRLLWGLVGTRYARFSEFVRGPSAALGYLRSLASAQPQHHVGHNPAGGLAILGLLGLAAFTAASGWATWQELGGDWLEELHEVVANTLMGLVVVHVVAVIGSSLLHRENLVAAMISGRKRGAPGEAARAAWRTVAAVLVVAVAGFWWWQYQDAPAAGALSEARSGQHHDDDD